VKTFGRVDSILNNAGVMPRSPLERFKVEDWERIIDVNLKGFSTGLPQRTFDMNIERNL
jgi:NADP-dependent 3-hydroxy acid dehydrogenase YdfG